MGAIKLTLGNKGYIFLFIFILFVCWLVYDVLLVREVTFNKVEAYSFVKKNKAEIKEKIRQELQRYESSEDSVNRVCALVHLLECNYYLIYNRDRKIERYFDFMKTILYPSQRKQLKDKQSYIQQANRYLKRRRNLPINFNSYDISSPIISDPPGEEIAEVVVMRIMIADELEDAQTDLNNVEKNREFFTYHFKRFTDGRFYLYFTNKNTQFSGHLHYRFRDDSQRPDGEKRERKK